MKKTERHQVALETFDAARPEGWKRTIKGQELSQGGHASVCLVEHDDGRRGVFRCLVPDAGETSITRFQRELRILTEKISHPNVVPILEWTRSSEHLWYISELGDSFQNFWERSRVDLQSNPERLLDSALHVLRGMCFGLAVCHEVGIVHRDVKPKNIVLKKDTAEPHPMIIDFGLANYSDEDRITASGDAVGNAQMSPDIMRWRMEHVLPWVDVFEVIQTFLWMIERKSPKHYWQRPVHWQHVQFHEALSPADGLSLRALAAICSSQTTSPKDAGDLLTLIDLLFTKDRKLKVVPDVSNVQKIVDNLRIGKANALLDQAANQEVCSASKPLAMRHYLLIRSVAETFLSSVGHLLATKTRKDESLEGIDLVTAKEDVHWCRKTLYEVKIGNGALAGNLKLICQAIPPQRIPAEDGRLPQWRRALPPLANIVTFVVSLRAERLERSFWIVLKNDGQILIQKLDHDQATPHPGKFQEHSEAELGSFLMGQLNDAEFWERMGRAT